MTCKRCLVSGRVQGVFYRAAARQRALALGIAGSARNLSDGRVEVYICGEEPDLTDMEAWLWQGPAHADVSDVVCEAIPETVFSGFDTG